MKINYRINMLADMLAEELAKVNTNNRYGDYSHQVVSAGKTYSVSVMARPVTSENCKDCTNLKDGRIIACNVFTSSDNPSRFYCQTCNRLLS